MSTPSPAVSILALLVSLLVPIAWPGLRTAGPRAQSDGAASAEAAADVARVLPASTWAFVRCAGFDSWGAFAEGLPLQKYLDRANDELAESGLGDMRAELVGEIAREMRSELGRRLPAMLHEVTRGGVAIGLGRPTMVAGVPLPSVVLAIDVGGDRELADRVRGEMLDALRAEVGERERNLDQQAHGTIETVWLDAPGAPPLCFARTSEWLLISNSPPYLRDCLATAAGEGAALSSSASLSEARARLDGQPLLDLFIDATQFRMLAPALVPYELGEICRAIGVDRFDGVYFGIGARGADATTLLAAMLPGAEDGLVRSLFGAPVDHGAARYCPPDTVLYAAMRVECRQAYAALERAARLVAAPFAEDFEEGFAEGFEEIADELELDPSDLEALVASLGSQITLSVPAIGGSSGLVPQPLAILSLQDRDFDAVATVRRVLAKIDDAPELRDIEYRGTRIGYLSIPDLGYFSSPAFAVHDGHLLVAVNVPALKSVIARVADGRASLADEEDFQARIVATRDAGHVAFDRVGRYVEPLWRSIEPFAMAAITEATDGEIDPLILPDPDEFADILGSSLVQVGATDRALFLEHRGRLGLGQMAAIAFGLLEDALERADGQGAKH